MDRNPTISTHPLRIRMALVPAWLVLLTAVWALASALNAGIVVGMDSLGYFAMSDSLVHSGTVATRHWPPGYPLLISALRLTGMDRLAAASVLNLAAFGISSLLALAWLGRVTGARAAWTLAGILWIVPSAPVLDVHRFAFSEAVFWVPAMASVLSAVAYLETGRLRWLEGAALLVGVGVWFRYAGAFWAPPVLLAPILFAAGPWRRRLGHALGALVFFCLPVAALECALASLAQEAGGARTLAWHLPAVSHLQQWGATSAGWLLPTRWVAASVPWQVLSVAGVVLFPLSAVVFLRKRNRIAAWFGFQALAYLAGLLLSVTLADHNTPLDARMLLPYYVSLVGCLVSAGSGLAGGRWRGLVLVALLLSGTWCGVRGVRYLAAARDRDDGFNSAAWRADPVPAWIRALPEDWLLCSNASGALWFHSGRDVQPFPRKWESVAARPADGLGRLLAAARGRAAGNIVLIHFPDWTDTRDESLDHVISALELDETARVGRATAYGREPLPGAAGARDGR